MELLTGTHYGDNIAGLRCSVYSDIVFFTLGRWLYKEWSRFGWKNGMIGVGLNEELLEFASSTNRLIVLLDGKSHNVFVANPKELLRNCDGWIVSHTARGVPIFGCPISLFYRYKGESIEELKSKWKQTNLNKWLYPTIRA